MAVPFNTQIAQDSPYIGGRKTNGKNLVFEQRMFDTLSSEENSVSPLDQGNEKYVSS